MVKKNGYIKEKEVWVQLFESCGNIHICRTGSKATRYSSYEDALNDRDSELKYFKPFQLK